MELAPYLVIGLTSSGFTYFCYQRYKSWKDRSRRYPLVKFDKNELLDDVDQECGLSIPSASDSLLAAENNNYQDVQKQNQPESVDDSRALLLAANYCKNSRLYIWKEKALLHIGRSNKKRHFLIESTTNSAAESKNEARAYIRITSMSKNKNMRLLALIKCPSGSSSISLNHDGKLNCVRSVIGALRNQPYLLPVMDADYVQSNASLDSVVFISPFSDKGSLKDLIYQAKPQVAYDQKYRGIQGKALSLRSIAKYGRHILEGLVVLKELGIPFFHLHSGNVVLEKGIAKLSNYENMFVLLEENVQVRDLVIPIEDYVDVEVALFGHVLYEMAFGIEINASGCYNGIPDYVGMKKAPPQVQEILDTIFARSSAVQDGDKKVNLKDILNFPLFQEVTPIEESPQISLSKDCRNFIKTCVKYYERRHAAELNAYHQQLKQQEEFQLQQQQELAAYQAEQEYLQSLGPSAQQRRRTYSAPAKRASYRYSRYGKSLHERLEKNAPSDESELPAGQAGKGELSTDACDDDSSTSLSNHEEKGKTIGRDAIHGKVKSDQLLNPTLFSGNAVNNV